MKKRVVAAMLASMMVFSLTACGGSEDATTTAAPTTTPAEKETTKANNETTTEADDDDLEPIVLIGADNAGNGAAAQLYGELVSEKVKKLSDGLLTVNYQPNGALGSDADIQQQMLDGDVDFVICQTAQTTSFVPEVAIFDLPMVFAKYDGAKIGQVLNDSDFGDALAECYEAKNMKIIHFLQNGTFRETTSNVEIRSLSDFEGLQIRTMENPNHQAFWNALGAAPTPLTWSEVYFTLQSGGLQAQENATDTCAGANLQEVQDYLILTHHILYCNQLIFNNEKFNSMPQQYQDWFYQAAEEAAEEIEADLLTLDQDSTQYMVDGGIEVIEFDDAFIDEVLAVEGVQQLYDDIDAQVGGGLVQMLQDELAK